MIERCPDCKMEAKVTQTIHCHNGDKVIIIECEHCQFCGALAPASWIDKEVYFSFSDPDTFDGVIEK